MGLDMYLIKRKKRIIKKDYWNFDKEEAYWRKANMVHKFFCDNGKEIQEQSIYKISKENLEELLNRCNRILDIVETKEGQVTNGYTLDKEGNWVPILEPGIVITNIDTISKILPTEDGFFFGSTEYNNFYLDDIKETKDKISKILDDFDFNNYNCYYLASW